VERFAIADSLEEHLTLLPAQRLFSHPEADESSGSCGCGDRRSLVGDRHFPAVRRTFLPRAFKL